MTNTEKAEKKRRLIDIGYLITWGLITLISSYNVVLHDCSFAFLMDMKADYNFIIIPLIVWMIAYFIDYVYTIIRKDAWEKISGESVVRASWAMSIFLFLIAFILAQNSYLLSHMNDICCNGSWLSVSSRTIIRTICLCGMFLVIMLLKWSSLTSLEIKEDVKRY